MEQLLRQNSVRNQRREPSFCNTTYPPVHNVRINPCIDCQRTTIMRTNYPSLIQESTEDLLFLERTLRGRPTQPRIKMLRLLKSGAYTSRSTLAETLGYSERQLQRWWKSYQECGLEGLLEEKSAGGSEERITEEAWHALNREMCQGRVRRLHEAQHYLQDRFGIKYRSLQGVSDMIQRRRERTT